MTRFLSVAYPYHLSSTDNICFVEYTEQRFGLIQFFQSFIIRANASLFQTMSRSTNNDNLNQLRIAPRPHTDPIGSDLYLFRIII